MHINQKAPVSAFGQIEVNATPETVWEIMTAIHRWPEWNPDIREVSVEGELKPGTKFRWKSGPGTIKSTLQTLQPPNTISWTGKTLGISAVHVWRMESLGDVTVVQTEESWDGFIATVFRKRSQEVLKNAIYSGLQFLKQAAETKDETTM